MSLIWYRRSVREELIEKILNKIPKPIKREYDVERYARDYVCKMELGYVKPGNQRLVEEGIEDVYSKIAENKKK